MENETQELREISILLKSLFANKTSKFRPPTSLSILWKCFQYANL